MGDSPPARSPRPPKPCSCWPPKKCQTDRPAPQSHTQAQLPRGCPPLADENCSRPIRRPLFVARSYGIPEIICSGRQPLRPGDREQVNLQAFVSVSPPDELLHRRIGAAANAERVAFFGNLPMLPDVIRGPIRNISPQPAVGIIAPQAIELRGFYPCDGRACKPPAPGFRSSTTSGNCPYEPRVRRYVMVAGAKLSAATESAEEAFWTAFGAARNPPDTGPPGQG